MDKINGYLLGFPILAVAILNVWMLLYLRQLNEKVGVLERLESSSDSKMRSDDKPEDKNDVAI